MLQMISISAHYDNFDTKTQAADMVLTEMVFDIRAYR